MLDHADQGSGPLLVLVTVVNGIAEELFFRGAAYAASTRYPVAGHDRRLRLATLATGNVMLAFAAVAARRGRRARSAAPPAASWRRS